MKFIRFTDYIIIIAFAMRFLSESTVNLSYILLAAYALLGPRQTIEAFFYSWFFTMVNPALVPDASSSIGRFAVIGAGVITQVIRLREIKISKLNLATGGLGVFIFVHSVLFSTIVDVSLLKLISWLAATMTLISAWKSLEGNVRTIQFEQIQNSLLFVVLLSIPAIFFPPVGYLLNGTGFQGLLNHPQAFGPVAALAVIIFTGKILESARPLWHQIVLLMTCVILVFLSEARTAALAMSLGIVCAVLFSPVLSGLKRRVITPGLFSSRVKLSLAILIVSSVFLTVLFPQFVSGYIFKRSETTSLFDAADASRGDLVEDMLVNINSNVLKGIGFGIGSKPELMIVEHDELTNLPLGAAVEKGVMPIAVIEELGLFGALLVFMWVYLILRESAHAGAKTFALVVTIFMLNLGESTLFSIGGTGMLIAIILTGAASCQKLRPNKQ